MSLHESGKLAFEERFLTLNVVFRADASVGIGSGHIVRCATLANRLRQQGAQVQFICKELPGNWIQWLKDAGFPVYVLPDSEDEAQLVVKWLQTQTQLPDWLVVDHYSLDTRWENAIRPYVKRLMAIDDLADRPHSCDVLLDHNLSLEPNRYQGLIPSGSQTLLGPKYCLLRPEFHEFRQKVQRVDRVLSDILVFFGGSDPTNETLKALQAFQALSWSDVEMNVVIGASNPNKQSLEKLASLIPNVTLHYQTPRIADLMLKADLFLGAGGTTTWERCCLGLPSLVLTIADNQEALTEAVAQYGAVICLGKAQETSWEEIRDSLDRIRRAPETLRQMSVLGMKLVDGLGTERVVQAMNNSSYQISLLTDQNSWINQYIPQFVEHLKYKGHQVRWIHDVDDLTTGDFAFYLSFGKIVSSETLAKHRHNLVVHESDLPVGKGWSPLTWQILEGLTQIPITLFEAQENVDSGPIYLQETMKFIGTELVEDLRMIQARATFELCGRFLENYPDILTQARPQSGQSSFYARRTPKDSLLDVNKTLKEQFNLLRVVDNERYPAYFDMNGETYLLKIEKKKDEIR